MTTTLFDATPNVRWAEIDWDPTPGALVADTSLHVMRLEAEFLDMVSRPEVDLQDTVTILTVESGWMGYLEELQRRHTEEKERVPHLYLSWANVRINWWVSRRIKVPQIKILLPAYHSSPG
jgi:hypothetical protein